MFNRLLRKFRLRRRQPTVLIEATSPSTPITAFVEQDERVIYFYLQGSEESHFGVRACWVRNLVAAPEALSRSGMAEGQPPLQPKEHCAHPGRAECPDPRDLSIVWLPEGNAAALLERNEILAIIPGWSGLDNFGGYARDAVGSSPVATELRTDMDIYRRVRDAEAQWRAWSDDDPFAACQSRQLEQYESAFGACTQYFAIDGDRFPPRGLYTHQGQEHFVAITVGMSMLPMPRAEMYAQDGVDVTRTEVGILLKHSIDRQEMQKLCNGISALAAVPWQQVTWLGEGHTVNFAFGDSSPFNTVFLTNRLSVLPKLALPEVFGGAPNILWMVPIHDTEREAFHTVGDRTLSERLRGMGANALSLKRELL